jgi:hypothetical protein
MTSIDDVHSADACGDIEARSLGVNHLEFFRAFGYLHLRDWLNAHIERLNRAFEEAVAYPGWRAFGRNVNEVRRTGAYTKPRVFLPLAIDRVPALAWLRHHASVTEIARALLGESWEYAGSDTNLFHGDTAWHHDSFLAGDTLHIQVMIYVDALDVQSGALRVVPGSHLEGHYRDMLLQRLSAPESIGSELPAQVLAVVPGDVVVIDSRTIHASFGGTSGRRLIAMRFGPRQRGVGDGWQRFVAACTTEVDPSM